MGTFNLEAQTLSSKKNRKAEAFSRACLHKLEIVHLGASFCKSSPKAGQRPCTPVILQHCCKIMEVFEGPREAFFKKFPCALRPPYD